MAQGITPDTLFTMMQGYESRIKRLEAALSTAGVAVTPSGVICHYGGPVPPAGWLKCDGSAISRTDYPGLFSALCPVLGIMTVTIASPGVITLANHGLNVGDPVYFTTTGSLPTNLSPNVIYFVTATSLAANTFTVAASYGGTAINTSGVQSGVHTLSRCPWGNGNGTTTFNLPNLMGKALVGAGSGTGTNVGTGGAGTPTGSSLTLRPVGAWGGEESHANTVGEMPSHSHRGDGAGGVGGVTGTGSTGTNTTGAGTTQANTTGGGTTGQDSPDHAHATSFQGGQSVGSTSIAYSTGNAGAFTLNGGWSLLNNPGANTRHTHSIPGLGIPALVVNGLSIPALSVPALAISANGGGGGHNTMQPWVAATPIIKT